MVPVDVMTPRSVAEAGLSGAPVQRRPRTRRFLFGAIYVVIIVITFLAVGELAVRTVVARFSPYRSFPFRQYDPQLGIALIPNLQVDHQRGCFQGEVSVNRWGMRDRPRSLEREGAGLRIALLGDSIVEGAQVRPDEVLNVRVEQLLHSRGNPDAEVLNFGIAGIGTAQELLLYEQRVRRFDPDLVVLLFTNNDVMNNSSTLQPKAYGIHTWYAPYYDLQSDGSLALRPVPRRALSRIRSEIERRSAFVYYVENLWSRVNVTTAYWQGVPIQWGVYGEPLDPEWAEAWQTTEALLGRLHEEVRSDGAQFIVLLWPTFFDIDPHWRGRLAGEIGRIPDALQPASFEKRLRAMAEKQGIRFDTLAPFMAQRRDELALAWPYFSFSCDSHPSPLGHRVGAEALVDRLESHGLLPLHGGRS